jgi:hypothetical protein
MSEMTADQRQRVKQEATRTALLDNNIAASLVVAGGLVSFVSPAHGISLGIGSGLFWLCANYRQSIANDPARDDFDQVWVTSANLDEDLLPGSDEQERAVNRFDAQVLLVCDGLYAVLRSLERFDGATAAGSDAGVAAQLDAIAQNAAATADRQDTLLALADDVNQVWAAHRDADGLSWSSADLASIQQFYRDTVGDLPPPSEAVATLAASVVGGADDLLEPFDTGLSHPVLEATELPAEPTPLIGDEFVGGINAMSAALRELVV